MNLQFSRTEAPSTVVGIDLENNQFFRAYTRTRTLFSKAHMEIAAAALSEVVALDQKAQALPSKYGPAHYIKIRQLYIDDKSGDFTMHVDYLYDQSISPAFSEDDIKLFLRHGTVQHFGQGQWVETSIKTGLFSSDHFSPVADEYYAKL